MPEKVKKCEKIGCVSDPHQVQQRQLLKYSNQKPNNAAAVSIKKRNKEEINTFVALTIRLYLISRSVFDNFIQFLYISYLLKGTGIIMGLCEDSSKFT